MKSWTVRLPDDLDKQLTEYAKVEEMSKNQVVKKRSKSFWKKRKTRVSAGEVRRWQ